MKNHLRLVMAGLTAAGLMMAADAGPAIVGPSLGYLYDANARTLTPVLGVAGASVRGNALALPDDVASVRMAPGQNYGIAILADGSVAVLDTGAGDVAIRKLDQAVANPDVIAFSPSGGFALLYEKSDGRLQTVGNLGAAPAVLRETSAAGAVALAASDDGQWTVFANSGGLWTVDAAGTLRQAGNQSDVTAAAFRHGSSNLVFATASAVFSVAIASAGSDAVLLKDELDTVSAVAQSADGAYVFARTGTGVTAVRTADGASTQVACDCEVTSFEGLRGRNVFRLSDSGTGPTYLFDGGGTVPRIVFIPGEAPADTDVSDGGAL